MGRIFVCLAALAMVACEEPGPQERRTETPTPAEDPAQETTGIQWAGTYANALKVARETNQPILAITVAPDNEDARAIENDLLTHPQVQELSRQFVNVRIDTTQDAEGLPEGLREPGQVVFLNPEGERIDAYQGRDPEALIARMQDVLKQAERRPEQGRAMPMQGEEREARAAPAQVWRRTDKAEAMKMAQEQNKRVLQIYARPPETSKEGEESTAHAGLVILKDEQVSQRLAEYVVFFVEESAPEGKPELLFLITDSQGRKLANVERADAQALAQALQEASAPKDGEEPPTPEEGKVHVWLRQPWSEAMAHAKERQGETLLFVLRPDDPAVDAFHRELRQDKALKERLGEMTLIKVYAPQAANLPEEIRSRAQDRTIVLRLDTQGQVKEEIELKTEALRSKLGMEPSPKD